MNYQYMNVFERAYETILDAVGRTEVNLETFENIEVE